MGNVAVERLLALAFIAAAPVGLTGCAPQSTGGFQAVTAPSPNPAAVERQSPTPAASTVAKVASPNAAAIQPAASPATIASTSASASSASASTSDYQVRPGDVLQINVFQLQDFTREAPVDAAGTIALPLIGAVPVAGKTVRQIEEEIAQRLKAKYLQNPQVLVSVKDAVGLRVAVQGAVKSPGVFPLHGDTTLTNIIAQSGRVYRDL